MKKLLSQSARIVFLALLFGAVAVYAQNSNFNGPLGDVDNYNAPLPINVSSDYQYKAGGFGASGLRIGPGPVPSNGAANVSLNLRVGGGTALASSIPGAGIIHALGKIAVGANVIPSNISGIPADSIMAEGQIYSAKGTWSAANVSAGLDAVINGPVYPAGSTAGTPGTPILSEAVRARWFCFPVSKGGCIDSWSAGGIGGSLTGSTDQTIRFSGTNTPVASSTMTNDGTRVTIGASMTDAYGRLNVGNGSLNIGRNGTDLLFLNNYGIGASRVSIITNTPDLQFWYGSPGNTGANIIAKDVTSSSLSNSPGGAYVCANSVGKLILCNTTPSQTDLCPNISGVQTAVPAGYTLNTVTGDCDPVSQPSGKFAVGFSGDGASCPGAVQTWTIPAGVTNFTIHAWGAGGDGAPLSGPTNGSFNTGSGGGSGGYATQTFTPVLGRGEVSINVGCNSNGAPQYGGTVGNGTDTSTSPYSLSSVTGGKSGNRGITGGFVTGGIGGSPNGENGENSIFCSSGTPNFSRGGQTTVTPSAVLSSSGATLANSYIADVSNNGRGGDSQNCDGTLAKNGAQGTVIIIYEY